MYPDIVCLIYTLIVTCHACDRIYLIQPLILTVFIINSIMPVRVYLIQSFDCDRFVSLLTKGLLKISSTDYYL